VRALAATIATKALTPYCSGRWCLYVGALLDLLDARGHGYLIKVKLKNRVVLIAAQQHGTAIAGQPDWEQYTVEYRCAEWKVTQCFVTVHRVLPKEESLQPDLLETAKYDIFCYVMGKAAVFIINFS